MRMPSYIITMAIVMTVTAINDTSITRDTVVYRDLTAQCLPVDGQCRSFNVCCMKKCPYENKRQQMCFVFLSEIDAEETYCLCQSGIVVKLYIGLPILLTVLHLLT